MKCQFKETEVQGVLFCVHCKTEQKSKYAPDKTHRICNEKPTVLDCQHRGEELRREQCPSCAGFVQVKVFGCAIHGECTVSKQINSIRNCSYCPDKVN